MTYQIKKWLQDIATRGDAAPAGIADGIAKRLRLNATVVAMGWKFTVMILRNTNRNIIYKPCESCVNPRVRNG